MTRMQVQLRLKALSKAGEMSEPPPSYEQALAMPSIRSVIGSKSASTGPMGNKEVEDGGSSNKAVDPERPGAATADEEGEEDEYSVNEDSFESESELSDHEDAGNDQETTVDWLAAAIVNQQELGADPSKKLTHPEPKEDSSRAIRRASEEKSKSWRQGDHKDGSSASPRADDSSNPKEAVYQWGKDRQSFCYYDEHTYTVISRLRATNKHLKHELQQQNKLVQHLVDEKKQHLQLIDTLRMDVQMHKQTLRAMQTTTTRAVDAAASACQARRTDSQRFESALPHVDPNNRAASLRVLTKPRPPRQHKAISPRDNWRNDDGESPRCRPPVSPSSSSSPRKSPRVKSSTSVASAAARGATGCSHQSHSQVTNAHLLEKFSARMKKVEEERKEMQMRHAHQLANYSHERSRLERQLDQAQRSMQEKDNELRLQRTRQMYYYSSTPPVGPGPSVTGSGSSAMGQRGSFSGSSQHHPNTHHSSGAVVDALQNQNIFSDDIWKGSLPVTTNTADVEEEPGTRARGALTVVPVPPTQASFTSHVGQAFEQLLGHQLCSFHDHSVDRSTRDWLQEVRRCGTQMLTLHHSFQALARSLQRLAESTHSYGLAEALASECCQLLHAEQTLVLVVDKSEQEFWCRLPQSPLRCEAEQETLHIATPTSAKKIMGTVRSALMPLPSPATPVDLVDGSAVSAAIPCGLASFVYHTKRPLLLAAGQMVRHANYSLATDNSDRLIEHPSGSTLLVPILHENRVLAVVQACGKLEQVEALGLSIALERCDAFSAEDQALLTLLCHFVSGLFPKVAYFTDVESNKVNEETLIQLAPEIFTCLRFDELGKVVIEKAKNILDADRCSLFVADNTTRTLHNWHSDISGAGIEVYHTTAGEAGTKKGGMTIHFGQGIVGLVAETQQAINIPDAYDDPRFNSAWDQKTHYRTKSMLTVPILSATAYKSAVECPVDSTKSNASNSDAAKQQDSKHTLLGVVQVINKSGGAPFRAKDEFLLGTISKLIALAIENSQLFQKNQELCWNVGKLISDGDLVEAIVSLGTAAEQIISVEGAAVYVVDPATKELVTFHHKRRHRIALAEPAYRGSLMEEAVRSQEVLIINDVATAPQFNAFVDSLVGLTARNVLFAPLVIEDVEADTTSTPTIEHTSLNVPSAGSSKKLVGLLQLVNTTGRKAHFDAHDLFLSIVQSQSCSVLAAILEKQRMLRRKEQIALLLDASMSFFKEMSVVGVINAVYNACTHIFDAETTAHLFLWEAEGTDSDQEHERHMWTSKICPHAAASIAARAPPQGSTSSIPRTADANTTNAMSFIPSLGTQARRLSVLMDQRLRAATDEGLFQQVLSHGSAVIVKKWVIQEEEETDDSRGGLEDHDQETNSDQRRHSGDRRARRRSARHRTPLDRYTMQATHADVRLGFTSNAVVACPVWNSYGLEIVGVLVLLFPRGHAAIAGGVHSEELSTLPILTRQISGALSVCHDLTTVATRAHKLQSMLELSLRAPRAALSLTLTARGHLAGFSQPVNVCSSAFNVSAMSQELHATAAANLTVHALYMDDEGHRWGFQLSGATAHEMSSEHYVQWIGKGVTSATGSSASTAFDKLRTDLQSVYVRKEAITGVVDTRMEASNDDDDGERAESVEVEAAASGTMSTLSRAVRAKLRKLLWEFVDDTWEVDVERACHVLFDSVTSSQSVCPATNDDGEDDAGGRVLLSRLELERKLGRGGNGVRLEAAEWDQLHTQFAAATGLVDGEALLLEARPQLRVFRVVNYELVPVLDTVTQAVVSVQVLLSAEM